jgi:hypothetical protein
MGTHLWNVQARVKMAAPPAALCTPTQPQSAEHARGRFESHFGAGSPRPASDPAAAADPGMRTQLGAPVSQRMTMLCRPLGSSPTKT